MITSLDSVLTFNCKVASEMDATFVVDLLQQFAVATSVEKNKTLNLWEVQVLFEQHHQPNIEQFMPFIQDGLKIQLQGAAILPLEQRDWLKENQESFPALDVGEFYIYGSHIKTPTPNGRIPLLIDAATAFGSGNHGSTRGCLVAISQLHIDNLMPNTILDIGCGSGILAMAAGKIWPDAKLMASDIDPECVRVTTENCQINHLPHIEIIEGNGFENPEILSAQPYQLVIANILASVLTEIAQDIAQVTATAGTVILSGILDTQKDEVLTAYSELGLTLYQDIHIEEWVTLVLKK